MVKYNRIEGGENNYRSGQRWSKEELQHVLDLYLTLPFGKGIHENNPMIHQLASYLGRTIRSVEAQLLMFRNLQRGGDYSWGHMNKICIKLWKEYLKSIGEKKNA